MSVGNLIRLAPGGSAISAVALLRVCRETDARAALFGAVSARFPDRIATFHASGRDAMRVAFARLAATSGRGEVAIPAYCCFSIAASAVAAGLRVRLVDVDGRGRLSGDALASVPFERVAAIVVGNLFGIPEPIAEVVRSAQAGGAAVIDDAAQALGARSPDGIVGGRGDVGILSFGRGKPVSALGGGAAIWKAGSAIAAEGAGMERPSRLGALARGVGFDLSRNPAVLRVLARIPSLEIGLTTYDPRIEHGAMAGAAVPLAAALFCELDDLNRSRRERAHALAARIQAETDFVPLLEPKDVAGVFPRLALGAPTNARRNRALTALVHLGATAMYPAPIDAIAAFLPHRADAEPCPGAHDFCARLLTLPTHSGLFASRADEVVRTLSRC